MLTPHEGELAAMLGEETAWVRAHRLEAVRRARERYRATVLLKGADTIVDGPWIHSVGRAAAGDRRHRRRPRRA